ncbi:GntR family transcriptional regulator [Gordonia asplenii]|uniref:GntR family transcriptional regulator n=1 Tax=Gordonia asplenii TaxID=2725283 RepID=UPI001FE76819|nr:GntR family transcriptional regulator [Gordonia asplenii]
MSAEGQIRPIESRSVATQVTDELRRTILNGTLAPGREFSLREIAGLLDVSFIPVREALRSLESEGLVIIRPGRSSRVTPLNLDDLHGIYRLRKILEPELASRSCQLLTVNELDRLAEHAVEFADEKLSMDAIYDSHLQFHLALLKPAATQWDARTLTTLWRAAERYIRIGFGLLDVDPHEHERRGEAHEHLIEAFRQRVPDLAAEAVFEHLARNEQAAHRALDAYNREPATAAR